MLPKILHIEPTDACNAACPQCAREVGPFDKNNLHHLTIQQIENLIDPTTIAQLDKMFMCGYYGDPAAGQHTLDIYKYFRQHNPAITLGMNTNGGLRSTSWWQELAGLICNQTDYVIFSLDGLADTNHVYRVNVDWDKVMNNAHAFISAGGQAHWEMLVFEHNQHQVEQAEQLARDMGFKWFRAKVTRRFDIAPVEFLKPPQGWRNPIVSQGQIECSALKESSLYISADAKLYPCCWLAPTDYTNDRFDIIKQSWSEEPHDICKMTCTKNELGTSFSNQWQREVAF